MAFNTLGFFTTLGFTGSPSYYGYDRLFDRQFFGGRILSRFKIGRLLAASSLAAGVALLGYALSPCWWTMVFAGFIAGLGAGAIDVALNTYVASYHGAGLMQLLHASYGVGATIGPVIMTIAITALNSWRWGYAVVGGLQLALAISFSLSVSLWEMQKSTSQKEKRKRCILADYKHLHAGNAAPAQRFG